MDRACVDFKISQFILFCGCTQYRKNTLGNIICITVNLVLIGPCIIVIVEE